MMDEQSERMKEGILQGKMEGGVWGRLKDA